MFTLRSWSILNSFLLRVEDSVLVSVFHHVTSQQYSLKSPFVLKTVILLKLYVCVCMQVCVDMDAQWEASDPLERQSYTVVSLLLWELGTDLFSTRKAVQLFDPSGFLFSKACPQNLCPELGICSPGSFSVSSALFDGFMWLCVSGPHCLFLWKYTSDEVWLPSLLFLIRRTSLSEGILVCLLASLFPFWGRISMDFWWELYLNLGITFANMDIFTVLICEHRRHFNLLVSF